MYYRKLNNAAMWRKIQKLRDLIKLTFNFKERTCWTCGRDLNIYDFLSDNTNFTPEYILKLWQTPILEFHCCECFRNLKSDELKKIEQELPTRICLNCNALIDIKKFSKFHNYLKIHEIRSLWLDPQYKIFCDNLCQRKYFKTYYDFLKKRKRKKQQQIKEKLKA
ncbi:MAG: hypothetical protein ACFFE4_02835 [Candidatus Thorarchaeota archaeon]